MDVFAGGAAGCEANFPVKIMEDVPCEDLPTILAGLVKHGAFKAMRQQLKKIPQQLLPGMANQAGAELVSAEAARPVITTADIPEGSAKLARVKGDEMAVFKSDGKVFGVQNTCPHEGGQLSQGWLEGGEVVCPLHGFKFSLQTGVCSTDPKLKVKIFKLVARGEGVTVEE